MIDKDRMYDVLERLVEVPGVSGTDSEVLAAYKIEEILMEIPYFAQHKENVQLVPVENDPLNRVIVTAYLECCPESNKTIILTGHYDVVDIDEYGSLKQDAYNIKKISSEMELIPMDEDARADYESGEWYFGRGTADMKYGHTLCIELLRYYAQRGGINGNLLYVAVCGEETNSEGMLRAVPFFNEMADRKGLDYQALLLTECYIVDDKAEKDVRYIHVGACGKIMPMFFFVGEATHAKAPFTGMDPNLLSAEVFRRMHLNPDFCQCQRGEVTPAPVCLKSMDLKSTYSVSIPTYGASYYNVISVDIDPEEMLEKLKSIAYDSFQSANQLYLDRQKEYESRFGILPQFHAPEPCVMTFVEINDAAEQNYEAKRQEGEPNYEAYIGARIKEMQEEKMEMQTIAVYIMKEIYELSGFNKPMIIVSFIPPYYPDVYPDFTQPKTKRLLEAMEDTMAYAKEKYNVSLRQRDYFMGISDMSYTGLDPNKDFDQVFHNIVGANQMYTLPQEDLKRFSVPAIDIGGYGKDFHKSTERLSKEYNFDVLPELHIHLIDDLLG